MKVSLNPNTDSNIKLKAQSFCGFTPVKSDDGFKNYKFNYVYDEDKYDCYVEFYKPLKDPYNNYYFEKNTNGIVSVGKVKLEPNKGIDLTEKFNIDDNEPFAYHYLLKNKHNAKDTKVMVDSGEVINLGSGGKSIFNIVSGTKSNLSSGGAMKLVIIDSQNVGYVYDKDNNIVYDEKLAQRGINGIKTITNKFGGTLAGLEKDVNDGKYDIYRRIISLPIFTDDDFTAHSYWNKNCMQMTSSLGNINNYASLQRAMFAHGINLVSDGAFV